MPNNLHTLGKQQYTKQHLTQLYRNTVLYLLFTNWVQGPYQEIQAQGFSYSPSLRGLFGKPRACISWYGTSTQLVNSLLHDPFLESE